MLGREPDAIPHCSHLPQVHTFQRGLGCLYVLEGSTLGARLISGRIESRFGIGDGSGGAFFNAYGESVGQKWAEFRDFVNAVLVQIF
jgi:heme oxygenase